MSKDELQVNFRMPASLKSELEALAKQNRRSLTAEVVARLESSIAETDDFGVSDRDRMDPENVFYSGAGARINTKIDREALMSTVDRDPASEQADTQKSEGIRVIKRNGSIFEYSDEAITQAVIRALESLGGESSPPGPKPRKRFPKE